MYKVIAGWSLLFLVYCSALYGAAIEGSLDERASYLSLHSGIPEEGWRWYQNLSIKKDDTVLPFNAVHESLAHIEFNISTKWKNFLETRTKPLPLGNIAVAAFSVIYKVRSEYKSATTHIAEDDTLERLYIFESGDDLAKRDTQVLEGLPFKLYSSKPVVSDPRFYRNLKANFEYGTGKSLDEKELEDRIKECKAKNDSAYMHSEQALRIFLGNPKNLEPLATRLKEKLVGKEEKAEESELEVYGTILHIHTRLDMCRRCAQTWAIESLLEDSGQGIFVLFKKILQDQGLSIDDAAYKSLIVVSGRDTYKGDSRYKLGLGPRDMAAPLSLNMRPRMFQHALMPIYLPLLPWARASEESAMISTEGPSAPLKLPPASIGITGASLPASRIKEATAAGGAGVEVEDTLSFAPKPMAMERLSVSMEGTLEKEIIRFKVAEDMVPKVREFLGKTHTLESLQSVSTDQYLIYIWEPRTDASEGKQSLGLHRIIDTYTGAGSKTFLHLIHMGDGRYIQLVVR